jgi:predicted membrane-bound mannosyltransferase/DNA-binding beta-propeller fold protein YncE
MASQSTFPAWLERPVLKDSAKLFTIENLLIAVIIILAIFSRFTLLGERVMSHDEVNHVVPSYDLYQGRGYRHDPVTHGPFQFHIVALSYFLFGDSDFTSRVPAATFSVAAIIFLVFAFRRYLGRTGALIAGTLFLISPYLLFYGRYTRNEGFIELIAVVLLYGILRYMEKGDRVGMFLVTLATVMHFIVKETAFIYTAEALIFLFVIFLVEVRRAMHHVPKKYDRFLLLMLVAMLLVFVALGAGMAMKGAATTNAESSPTVSTGPQLPNLGGSPFDTSHIRLYIIGGSVLAALVAGVLGMLTLASGLGWDRIRQLRSFTLIIIIGTLILPMLSPFPVSMLGWNSLDYANSISMLRTGIFIALFFLIGAAIGIWWNPFLWLQNALVFYSIFTVFYTTFFTNGNGFYTGLVGSLGYWLAQQGVERGSQPLYYYALIQMPIYEFIGLLGTVLAVYFGVRYKRFSTLPGFAPAHSPRFVDPEEEYKVVETEEPIEIPATGGGEGEEKEIDDDENLDIEGSEEAEIDIHAADANRRMLTQAATAEFYRLPRPLPVLALFLYWGIISLVAFSFAGERMPWLTVHITLGFLLAAAWGIGYLVDTTDWKQVTRTNGLLAVLLIPVLFASLSSVLGALLGTNPPFQGNTMEQLQVTNGFIIALIASGASLAGILYLVRGWEARDVLRLITLVFFALMAALTARAAYRASFINYDSAKEYLVYAHAAPGPKEVLKQVEEISHRTVGGKNVQVAYSSDALYPYWWYLRDYPNKRWFQSTPTRDLRDVPIVIAGEDVFNKIDTVLGDNFYKFDYIRLWWPNQDYYNLTWDRIWGVIKDPKMRQALFDIWLNRDYTQYATLTNQVAPLSAEEWSPSARMRLYIRKDIVAKIWQYGASPVVSNPASTDPYAAKLTKLTPVQVIGATGSQNGQFQAPRGMKVAPDGSLYVADSRNHRIQHIAADGSFIKAWGTFADAASASGNAPGGTFNEPWDVAIGKDGSVYVSDTWNHRVQKFTADGDFVKMWGYFGQGEAPDAFWGPRGLAVDKDGRLYVMDTGNKRVVIFDPDGNFIAQFGSAGVDKGQFDEPVGITLDAQGNVYITDTWNQRVQVMAPSNNGTTYSPLISWDITGWAGQSLDNKPFIAVSPVNGHVFVTDPEKPRVLEFDSQGQFLTGWGDYSTGTDGFGLASGVSVTEDGAIWISDGANNVLLKFTDPVK